LRDYRHQIRNQEIVLHRNSIIAGYGLPENSEPRIIGILLPGDFIAWDNSLILQVKEAYLIVHLLQPFLIQRTDHAIELESFETDGLGRVAIRYTSFSGHTLKLVCCPPEALHEGVRRIDGQEVHFSSYSI
jgi:hypothetical protein